MTIIGYQLVHVIILKVQKQVQRMTGVEITLKRTHSFQKHLRKISLRVETQLERPVFIQEEEAVRRRIY